MSKSILALATVLVGISISPAISLAQSEQGHRPGSLSARRPANLNPAALRHDPNDPRYRPHPSGGRPAAFDKKYADQARSGQSWRIVRDCASACTMGFGHFAKSKICIGSNVRLGFHEGNNPRSTQMMWNSYPADVRALINSKGGMRPEWLWIPAREFHKLGYPKC